MLLIIGQDTAPESNGEGGPFEELVNRAIWVVGGRPAVQDVLWLRGCRIPATCFSPGQHLALFCAPEAWGHLVPACQLELVLGRNTVWAMFDHVLFLLIILEQKNHIPSKDKIIILSMSHRPCIFISAASAPLTFSHSAIGRAPSSLLSLNSLPPSLS